MRASRAYIFFPLLFCSCKKAAPALFELLPPSRTGIDFANTLAESDSLNILNYVYYYNGGGVGIADLDNDGREDILFTGNETSCRLYLNKGGLRFEDVTKQAGLQTTQWCTGVAMADVNADGWTDIYLCTAGSPQPEHRRNLLFINQGGKALAFVESAAAYGVADTGYSTHAAFFDYDRDGDPDLYVMNHANERQTLNTPLPKKTNGEGSSNDRLYRNNGNRTFSDVTRAAGILTEGYGLSIAVSDVNGDGWPDIYVANDFIYNDILYINQQGKGFSNQIGRYLRHQSYNSMGCDFADFNNDTRPDLVVVDMLPETDFGQKTMAGAMTWNKWQLIEQAGYEPQYMRNTLQMAVDGGRWTVDGGRWTVDGGRWTVDGEPSTVSRLPSPVHHLPSPVSRPPSTVSRPPSPVHRLPSTVHRLPSTVYAEMAQMAGISATDWSWAPLFADFDNDGWKDLFITNGYLRDITDKDFIDYSNNLSMFKSPAEADRELLPLIRQLKSKSLPNRIFQNNRGLSFSPRAEAWGMTRPSCSNGAAYADLDADGDLDLVVNNINEPAFVYENKADKLLKNNYLNIKLEGAKGNGPGLGVTVTIVSNGQRQLVEQYRSRGFMSTVTSVLHFGLGDRQTKVDSLEVRWPNGTSQVLLGVAPNQTLTLKQSDALPVVPTDAPAPLALMAAVTGQHGIHFLHRESVFNDFQDQPLLPHGFSSNGPPIATGDLNGDGLEDCYIGGAKDQAGRLFYQNPDGNFSGLDLVEGHEAEDTDALIFDANGDGHNDLYVVSGGNEWEPGSPFYQDRLYLNDGAGSLKWAKNALPEMHTPGNCVAAADFDGDGDLDLFVGGSARPLNYPLPARSYLLRNDGGKFSDVTEAVSSGKSNQPVSLQFPGIVNAACWADLDSDDSPDLVLAGEWMPVTVFQNKKGNLIEVTARMGLAETAGWWNCLSVHDLDGDGDLDLVAGNLGLNSKFKASARAPLTIYADDFDRNGRLDAVICRFAEGKEKPVHQRDELLAQVNGLGKKYPRYALYAAATVQDMFGEKALSAAYARQCQTLQSACFFNENGQFRVQPLPRPAQIAPVNAILCADFNADRHIDILLTGNSDAPNISTGRYDASSGLLLTGDGTGAFRSLDVRYSGFFLDGVAESLEAITLKSGKKCILAGVNGGILQVFEMDSNHILFTNKVN